MFNSVLDENGKKGREKKAIIQGADDKLGFGTRVGLVLTRNLHLLQQYKLQQTISLSSEI